MGFLLGSMSGNYLKDENIVAVWQPIGYSTHEIARWVGEKYGVKCSHTGTLDPMAEGVVVVLLGEDRHKKYEYASWVKEYEFEVVLGLGTDSFDGLGLVTDVDFDAVGGLDLGADVIDEVLVGFLGDYEQSVPPYSAIKVGGKPLHWYARCGELEGVKLPVRKGTVLDIELLDIGEVVLGDLVGYLEDVIGKIEGDLRQEEVVEGWQQHLEKHGNLPLKTMKIRVQTTKGLYIRRLSQDICEKLGVYGFVSRLVRTKNGVFDKDGTIPIGNLIK